MYNRLSEMLMNRKNYVNLLTELDELLNKKNISEKYNLTDKSSIKIIGETIGNDDDCVTKNIIDNLGLETKNINITLKKMTECVINSDDEITELNSIMISGILDNAHEYKIFGKKKIGSNLFKGLNDIKDDYLYFIINKNNLIVGSDIIPAILWYYYDLNEDNVMSECKNLIDTYNPRIYPEEFTNNVRGFVIAYGDNIDLHDLEKYFLFNTNFEHLIWGSAYVDCPFRQQVINSEINALDVAKLTSYSLKQIDTSTNMISCRTKISKSIIRFEEYMGAIVVDIQYNPMYNRSINNTSTNFPTDLPFDVISPLLIFPYENNISILGMDPISVDVIQLSFMLSISEKTNSEIYDELQKKYNNKQIKDNELHNFVGYLLTNNKSKSSHVTEQNQ
ncbi:MAG: hypothetical protein Terrestrivirus7_52 [Terrestrivirus sp.]|uniref:Uncharacterized protein n=1 Tax=Terrestrivirus sp. TaxID=2487775 RepID=A0A3G4ZSS9_9VIRU|nr:MAG: hypothetical protein Terrestrivirus7_52 [Terrestrivirus sp.]